MTDTLPPTPSASSQLGALFEVTRALSSSLDLDEVLDLAMDSAIRLARAERGYLMGLEADSGNLEVMVARNVNQEDLSPTESESLAVSRTVMAQVAKTGEAVVTTNAQDDPRFAERASVVSYALRSIMCAPLKVRGQTIGVVYVDNRVKTGIFSEDDLALLSAFATAAAVAIENARLYTLTDQALQARVAELEMMQQVDRSLNSAQEYDAVLNLTLDWAMRGTGASEGWLALLDGDTKTLTVAAGTNKGTTLPTDHPALRAANPVTVREQGSTQLMTALRRDRAVLGIIAMRATHPFSEEAQAFMVRFADHAAIAIENVQLTERLRRANEAKNQFISHISHELRLPMTSIQGYADLLKANMGGELSEQQRQFVEVIRNNVGRMKALVSDLADISRIESGRLKVEPREIPVASVINDALTSLRPLIDGRNQTLTMTLADDLPLVWADHSRLHQILVNLVSNANKYTPDGGSITVQASTEGDRVRIDVSDNGIGMTAEELEQLFEQFFRSEKQTVRDQQGWGLGLHVTRLLINALGGRIDVTSTEGAGSTFSIWLPTQPQE